MPSYPSSGQSTLKWWVRCSGSRQDFRQFAVPAGTLDGFRYQQNLCCKSSSVPVEWSDLRTGAGLTSFGQDAAGELYILHDQTLYRIESP